MKFPISTRKKLPNNRMTKAINLIFPHQLFSESQLLENKHDIYLIEEFLFFKQYQFHQQKIAFHRASMKAYQKYLEERGKQVYYIDANNKIADVQQFDKEIQQKSIQQIHVIDPSDDWLEQRIHALASLCDLKMYQNPQFINSRKDLSTFFRPDKKTFFQTTFYKQQRKKHKILLDEQLEPLGGKWTYDAENRKKYPKDKIPPPVFFPETNEIWEEAVAYTQLHFSSNPGQVTTDRYYPIDHHEAEEWLEQFLTYRFYDFGLYEDAIVKENSLLNHSLLSPLLNAGLILPDKVINRSLTFAQKEDIPINSVEGFIRQIIGWREFIRGIYISKGRYSRTRNFWKFNRKIPPCFYNGTTGIYPIDQTIKKVLKTGYCHHIERLMILGNFMLLCEFDPDEVYQWFMELFIDSYDWVMVPNVYGMCLYADGGLFATKPYIGGSNYIRKMSNYPKGNWEEIWDGLFWRFIANNQDFFLSNPRSSMLVYSYRKMPEDKQKKHLYHACHFIETKLK